MLLVQRVLMEGLPHLGTHDPERFTQTGIPDDGLRPGTGFPIWLEAAVQLLPGLIFDGELLVLRDDGAIGRLALNHDSTRDSLYRTG
ncbi:hypothetical protein ACIBCC_35910 [Streptomyces griseus]|uniref:hypothetical protein n=1 Tax=Streptomyces griseus TaxID=1911 RepID=UPI00379620EE